MFCNMTDAFVGRNFGLLVVYLRVLERGVDWGVVFSIIAQRVNLVNWIRLFVKFIKFLSVPFYAENEILLSIITKSSGGIFSASEVLKTPIKGNKFV